MFPNQLKMNYTNQEPPVFRSCFNIFDAEKRTDACSQQLLTALADLSRDITTSQMIELVQVFPVVMKMLCRLLARSMSIGEGKFAHIKVELALVQKIKVLCQLQLDTLSKLYSSCRDHINKLMFLNTAALEATKAAPSSADNEHAAKLVLSFVHSFLTIWSQDVQADSAPLPALTGPFLAQLLQSCLSTSQHRSKELAVTALRALSVMMDTLRDSSGCEEGNGEGAVGGDCETPDGVSTWRTFFPGIFGSLFVSCNASYKRGTPVLAAALECLLKITALVTSDSLYADLLPPVSLESMSTDTGVSTGVDNGAETAFKGLLQSAVSRFNSPDMGAGAGSMGASSGSDRAKAVRSKAGGVCDGVPVTPASLEWRVDTAQRIVQHIPVAYRKVWSAMSPSAIASKLRLIDSLSLLLRGSAGFVGSVGVVTLLLPMLECAQDGQTDVRRRVELKVRELQSAWKDTVWTDVQSQLIQRFVDNVWALGGLVSSHRGGGQEDAILSLLSSALGAVSLLPPRALEQAMSLLMSGAETDAPLSSSTAERSKETRRDSCGALRCLQRLLVCEVSESASKGGGFGAGSTGRLCVLSARRYVSADGSLYADAGYYRSAFVHMRDIGGSLDECVSPPLDSDGVPLSRTSTAAAEGGSDSSELESVSVPPRRRALGLIAQLGGLLGANDVCLDALVSLWSTAMGRVETISVYRSNHRSHRFSRQSPPPATTADGSGGGLAIERGGAAQRQARVSDSTASIATAVHTLQMAAAACTLLDLAIRTDNGQSSEPKTITAPVSGNERQIKGDEVSCALCGAEGVFERGGVKGLGCKRAMLRCSQCRKVHYCSKQHQAKHWAAHKANCSPTVGSADRPAMPSDKRSSVSMGPQQSPATATVAESTANGTPLRGQITQEAHRTCVRRVGRRVAQGIVHFLHFFLSDDISDAMKLMIKAASSSSDITTEGEGDAKSRDSANISVRRAMELLVSSVLELLGTLFTTCPDVGQVSLIQIIVPVLCVTMCGEGVPSTTQTISSSPSRVVSAAATANGVVRQAALTTLLRMALALNCKSGRDFLRGNLDYIVDDVCASLRYVRRLSLHQKRSAAHSSRGPDDASGVSQRAVGAAGRKGLNVGIYDDKIIGVVGAVLAEIDFSPCESGGEEAPPGNPQGDAEAEEVAMILRDLVSEALEAVDGLCAVATGRDGQDTFWNGKHMLAPLLSLMHSLVLRAVPPLPSLPDAYTHPPLRHFLFPFRMHHCAPRVADSVSRAYTATDGEKTGPQTPGSPSQQPETEETQKLNQSPVANGRAERTKVTQCPIESVAQGGQIDHDDTSDPLTGDDEEEERQSHVSRGIEMVRSILDRCCYFLTVSDVSAQVMVLSTMQAAFTRLAHNRRILLPAAHRVWPVLMNRMQEQRQLFVSALEQQVSGGSSAADATHAGASLGRSAYLLHHLMEFVTLLAFLCGDFVNMKFKEDLWKELLPILYVISHQSLAELILLQQHQQQPHVHASADHAKAAKGTRNVKKQLGSVGVGAVADGKAFDPQSVSALISRYVTQGSKSPHSLTEKVKVSLLKCLHQLAVTDFTLYAADPFAQPQPLPFTASKQSKVDANPLTVVAPVVIYLTVPLLSICEGPHIHQAALRTLSAVAQLSVSFARDLCFCLQGGAAGKEVVQTVRHALSNPISGEREVIVSKWQGIVTHPVLLDSYSHFTNLLSRRFKRRALQEDKLLLQLQSATNSCLAAPNKRLDTSKSATSVVLPLSPSAPSTEGLNASTTATGDWLLRERSTVVKSKRTDSSDNKITIVPQHELTLATYCEDVSIAHHMAVLLGRVDGEGTDASPT